MQSLLVSGSKNDRQPKPRSQARLQAKQKRPSASSKANASHPPRVPASFEMVDQKLANTFMPEGCLIWKCRGAGAWISKITGFKECN